MEQTKHTGYVDGNGMSRIKDDLKKPRQDSVAPPDMLRMAAIKARPIQVGIVGAGFAGLRCADVLLRHGFKVTILEARNRLGGRVAQSEHLGHTVDLGPNWIHGTDDNPIMELARKTNTRLHELDENAAVFDENGNTLSEAETAEFSSLLWEEGVIAAAFKYSNEHINTNTIDPQKSLYDFFVDKVEEMFLKEHASERERKRRIFLQLAWMWSVYIGSPVTRQSLKFFWLEECIEGENPFVAGTYKKVLEEVMKPAREGADVRLNTEVVEIVSASEDKESRPSVRTAAGPTLPFDEIVVAAPLGWLKRNKSAFKTELPSRLSQAIDNISYGTLDKVYITFPKAFWSDSHKDTTKGEPGFFHWLEPKYASSTNPRQWMQEGMNLAALPSSTAHPTLLFYIAGDQSTHIAKLATTSKTPDADLIDFFQPYFSLLPNYSATDPDCIPTKVLATAWAADKFAGYGSYANFQVGLEKGDEDIEVMREGMPDRRVWLAGEHTAPFVALGTSTGAYMSGERVAERIAKAYGVEAKV